MNYKQLSLDISIILFNIIFVLIVVIKLLENKIPPIIIIPIIPILASVYVGIKFSNIYTNSTNKFIFINSRNLIYAAMFIEVAILSAIIIFT